MRQVYTLSDPESLAKDAASRFVRVAKDAIATRGMFTVALAGGSTPRLTYSLLAGEPYRSQVDWSKIQFFWGDERCVPPDHKDSNYRMAIETLLSHVLVQESQLHRMRGEDPDPSKAAADYERQLRLVFGEAGIPKFDLILLGIGPDGHTLSLFPGSKALAETNKLVVANWVEKFQTWRITFTAPLANNAAHILFQVEGADKKAALQEILHGEYQPAIYPAQLIQPGNGECDWLIVT
jgi:6-phosphogluconolactonase